MMTSLHIILLHPVPSLPVELQAVCFNMARGVVRGSHSRRSGEMAHTFSVL